MVLRPLNNENYRLYWKRTSY